MQAERQTGESKSEESAAPLGRWQRPTIISLADQAVFSGSMLLVNILLARWTSPEEFGAFAVLFAVFLIFAGFHNALIIEPMSVFGARKEAAALILNRCLTAILLAWSDRSLLFVPAPAVDHWVEEGANV